MFWAFVIIAPGGWDSRFASIFIMWRAVFGHLPKNSATAQSMHNHFIVFSIEIDKISVQDFHSACELLSKQCEQQIFKFIELLTEK